MSKQIRIAVDAMGGDFAPSEIVKGSVQGASEYNVAIVLAGIKSQIEAELAKYDTDKLNIEIVQADEVIRDGEDAAFAVMRKPKSSIATIMKMVKSGEADAALSAGSTGAVMVAALQYIGTLPGIERPVAGGNFLGLSPKTVMVDLGANVGIQPYHLVDFAVIGTVYARTYLNIENPTVGLLSIGSEEGKGNEQVKEAYNLLKKSGLNFIGNVEGHDIPIGKANVIVCDGFVGNIVIKLCESLGRVIKYWLSNELKDKVNESDLKNVTDKLYRAMSPATIMGGGPLLGVNGVASVAHGASKAQQIVGTIKITKEAVETGFVNILRNELEKVKAKISEQSTN